MEASLSASKDTHLRFSFWLIISQIDKDYYSYKYTACPLSFSRSSQKSMWAKKRKHYMQSLSIHI